MCYCTFSCQISGTLFNNCLHVFADINETMNDNVTFLGMDDDEDKTVFQSEEDRKKLEQEIAQLTDEDDTEIDTTEKMVPAGRPFWQQVFG